MFEKLFAESGLSLDRLKTLLEVGAGGSIVKAAGGDPVRQSQYSRQLKELEDFFRVRLVEREGRGMRLTERGRELARISRFFMMGLGSFQRGCLAEEQVFKIGGSATFIRHFLVPAVAGGKGESVHYATETLGDGDIERRLHDLTLDFGIIGREELSRPLQGKLLGRWELELWVPRAMAKTEAVVRREFEAQRLRLAIARKELETLAIDALTEYPAGWACDSFVEAQAALESGGWAAILPDFLGSKAANGRFLRLRLGRWPGLAFFLAWNPRMLRLNPEAERQREWLAGVLKPGAGGGLANR